MNASIPQGRPIRRPLTAGENDQVTKNIARLVKDFPAPAGVNPGEILKTKHRTQAESDYLATLEDAALRVPTMEQTKLTTINDRLRNSGKVIREVTDLLENGAAKATKILASRDSIDGAIGKTAIDVRAAVERGDASALAELSQRLAQQTSNRQKLTEEFETALGAAGAQAIQTLAPLANACLACIPALQALQRNLGDLPHEVVQRLSAGLEGIKL